MLELTLLLGAAALALAFTRRGDIPSVPLMVLTGALLSATGLVTEPQVQDVLVLALTVLVFTAGTSLEVAPAGHQRTSALRVGFLQFTVLGGLGLAVSLLLGYRWTPALHLAVALAASSTLLGVRMLQRRRQLFEPFGRLVVGVLLLQDGLVVLLIPFLAHTDPGAGALLPSLSATLGMMGMALLVRRYVGPTLLDRLDLDTETWLLVFLATLFVFLGAADAFGVPAVTAAFLAGFSLSRFPVSAVARGQLSSLTDFFSALFFTALGTWIVVPGARELVHGLLLAAVVVTVTPPLVAFAAERRGFTARTGLLSGLLLSQTSEFSLVVGIQGAAAGLLEPETFTVIALVTLFTMTLTPLLTTDRTVWALMRWHPLRRAPDPPPIPHDPVLLLGCGSNGMEVLDLLVVEGVGVVVVDEDPGVVGYLQDSGIPVIRGDAADPEVLEAAGLDRARVVVSTLRRVEDNEAVLRLAGDTPVLVRAFELDDEEWVRRRGGIPVSFAQATAEDFLTWYVLRGGADTGSETPARSLQHDREPGAGPEGRGGSTTDDRRESRPEEGE